MVSYSELLAFHIDAQHGFFIDEVVPAAAGAGVMVFSRRETEPMWNLFFVDQVEAAVAHQAEIVLAFAMRQREPVWYLPDQPGVCLPPVWRATGKNTWMARPQSVVPHRLRAGLTLQRVETATQKQLFNQLYIDVYWGSTPPADIALPLDATPTWRDANDTFEVQHWLLMSQNRGLALLTAISRDGLSAIYNVGTHPEFTRQGLASQAMLAALTELDRLGCKNSFLLTECDETLAPFYARLGYEIVTTGQFYTLAVGDR